MILVYATLHWDITRPHLFTPFLSCNIGHAFAPKQHVCGGFNLSLAVGYHHQEYNQLASFENTIFITQNIEEISNYAITASIGCSF